MKTHTKHTDMMEKLIKDCFHADMHILSYPYADAHLMDKGIRKLLWEGFDYSAELAAGLGALREYRLISQRSNLGFYNILAVIPDGKHPRILSVGPFLISPVPDGQFPEELKSGNMPEEITKKVRAFYSGLPVVALNDLLQTLRHMLEYVYPVFGSLPVDFVSFEGEPERPMNHKAEGAGLIAFEDADAGAGLIRMYLNHVAHGKVKSALRVVDRLTREIFRSILVANAAGNIRALHTLSSFCMSKLLEGTVHPRHVFEVYLELQDRIDRVTTKEQYILMSHELTERYCALVTGFAYARYSDTVRAMLQYIDAHLGETVSLDGIAGYLAKNPSYLSAKFKAEVNMGVVEYIRDKKVKTAAGLMAATDLPISEIALMVGYEDFGYFSRVFRTVTGKSPTAYRAALGVPHTGRGG